MILNTLTLGAMDTNCYLISDEATGNTMVVDVPDNADKIIEFAKDNNLIITHIALTHGHFDHILALSELKSKTGAALSIFEGTDDFIHKSHLNLGEHMGIKCEVAEADKILCDGDTIDFFGNEIKVIHTPGHTADSICLYFDNILISGDTLFRRSVGRWDFPTGDMNKEINSIKEKLMCLPDDTEVYPGHGPMTTIGEERRGNPYII